jgi:hypothetical protein
MGLVRTGARSMAMTWGLALVLALAVFFAGCDSQPDPTVATSGGKKAVRNTSSTDADDPDMVTAFSNTRGQAGLVDLKFKLTKRPAVGEPVEVELALVPAVELEHLFARFQAAEGLQIVSGGETEHFDHPATGVPVKHKMTVTAKSDGIFYVTAIGQGVRRAQLLLPAHCRAGPQGGAGRAPRGIECRRAHVGGRFAVARRRLWRPTLAFVPLVGGLLRGGCRVWKSGKLVTRPGRPRLL